MMNLFIAAALALPFDTTTVEVEKNNPVAEFAAKELNTIVKEATGRAFGKSEPETGDSKQLRRKIIIRRDDAYADEESAVYEQGGNIYLVGGGQLGCLYAVYDFLEDDLNFRHYFWYENGFVVDKVDQVSFNGTATRNRPKFRGQRIDHHNCHIEALFEVRNRGNGQNIETLIKGYTYKYGNRIPGHGFHPQFIPRDDPAKGFIQWSKSPVTNGYFKTHPEWFTLDKNGKRIKDAQICLFNPELREELYRNLVKWIKVKGPGFYMVGSNDDHGDRYCFCEGCLALEKKYSSIGGPLWDWILWACPRLKAEGYEGVYIKTLAYKGPQQTERAPSGVERFPENFVCDAAFLNGDRALKYVPDQQLEDGTVFNRLQNLHRWCKLCDHVSYWYYGGSNPGQVYSRITEEFRELYEAGVKSVGACGTGGGPEFGDFTGWIFFRLLRDPYCDLEPDLRRIFAVKYGPAAAKAREYVDQLDALVRAQVAVKEEVTSWDDIYERFTFLSGKDLFRLRSIADEALQLARGTPFEDHVHFIRFGINVWTIRMFAKMKSEDCEAAAKIDLAALDAEVREYQPKWIDELYPASLGPNNLYRLAKLKNLHLPVLQLDEMANYMNLKSETLPAELAGYPEEKVVRILPPKRKELPKIWGGGWTCEPDKDAAAGFAWYEGNPGKRGKNAPAETGKFKIECYNTVSRKWLLRKDFPMSVFKPGEYTLVKLGRMIIPEGYWMVFDSMWASNVGIKTPARLFDPTYANKEYDVWISAKCEGPWYFKDAPADAHSAFSVDQVFCVDMGVP